MLPVLRTLERGSAAIQYVACDFRRLADVAAGADEIARAAVGPIDGLINNAGVPGSPTREVTADGHERTLQVNYFAMVLLTEHLMPALADHARVVNVASATHEMTRLGLPDLELERDYSAVRAYARSKLAVIMYTRWLAQHRNTRGITSVSLSPGVINTDLLLAMFGSIGDSVERGARNVIAALTTPARGGEYFDDGRLVEPSTQALRDELIDELMAITFDALAPHLPRPV